MELIFNKFKELNPLIYFKTIIADVKPRHSIIDKLSKNRLIGIESLILYDFFRYTIVIDISHIIKFISFITSEMNSTILTNDFKLSLIKISQGSNEAFK